LALGRFERGAGHVIEESDGQALTRALLAMTRDFAAVRMRGACRAAVRRMARLKTNDQLFLLPLVFFFGSASFTCLRSCCQGLIQILDDVVDMFDPDAEANHLRQYSSALLLLGRHLPVRS
jgi:hypothetical protein